MFTMLIVLVLCVNMVMFPSQHWTQNTAETESNILSEMKNEKKYFGGQTINPDGGTREKYSGLQKKFAQVSLFQTPFSPKTKQCYSDVTPENPEI